MRFAADDSSTHMCDAEQRCSFTRCVCRWIFEGNAMPKGPQGQRRPADLIGCAVKVMRIATGDEEEKVNTSSGRRRSGYAGAKARVESTTSEERVAIAKKA